MRSLRNALYLTSAPASLHALSGSGTFLESPRPWPSGEVVSLAHQVVRGTRCIAEGPAAPANSTRRGVEQSTRVSWVRGTTPCQHCAPTSSEHGAKRDSQSTLRSSCSGCRRQRMPNIVNRAVRPFAWVTCVVLWRSLPITKFLPTGFPKALAFQLCCRFSEFLETPIKGTLVDQSAHNCNGHVAVRGEVIWMESAHEVQKAEGAQRTMPDRPFAWATSPTHEPSSHSSGIPPSNPMAVDQMPSHNMLPTRASFSLCGSPEGWRSATVSARCTEDLERNEWCPRRVGLRGRAATRLPPVLDVCCP